MPSGSARRTAREYRTDVEAQPAVGQLVVRSDPALRVALECRGCDDIDGQIGVVRKRIIVTQLLCHLAADENGVRAGTEVHEHPELVGDLRPARDQDERVLDVAEEPAEHLQLLLEEQARVGREQVRDPLGRRVRSMRRAERVVHEQIPSGGEATRRLRVVRRLARIEARVLEYFDAMVRQKLAETRRHGRNRERGIGAFRPTEVRADRHVRCASLQQMSKRRQRRADPRVVGDPPVLERNVQVRPHEDALARDVRVTNRARPMHFYGRSLPIRSTSRHE